METSSQRAGRGLVAQPAERTGHGHIRGGGLGIQQGLLRHRSVEAHRPHPGRDAFRAGKPWLDPVVPKDAVFSKIFEESPRPRAPRRGSSSREGWREAGSAEAQGPGTGRYWRQLPKGEVRRWQWISGRDQGLGASDKAGCRSRRDFKSTL